VGNTFTNLIKTLDETKVISIEAGFGRGKTFFRKAWSQQLRDTGEVVVEIDLQQSDHSGDPLITFLAALVEALPKEEKGKGTKALDTAKKVAAIGGRAVAKIALRAGATEVIDAISDSAMDKLDDFDALDDLVKGLGDGMSKAAGQMIAAQMAAERVRKQELPEQLSALRAALTEGRNTDRVVIVVDELDRCHPAYAIAVLEAMKLVFGQSGFVFCLMVNANYLENLAQHQFGVSSDDEKYLDKFVDIRLRLKPQDENIKKAVVTLASELPLNIPYGEGEAFSVLTAAELAGDLAVKTNMSMRQVKRVLLQVELALRCYANLPLDASLLVLLAFELSYGKGFDTKFLSRSEITPEFGEQILANMTRSRDSIDDHRSRESRDRHYEFVVKADKQAFRIAPELLDLPIERFGGYPEKNYPHWAKLSQLIAPQYQPFHRDVLGAIAEISV
jgi:hypothetical protein